MTTRTTSILLVTLLLTVCGCVERKLTVTSTPPGARVYLDDQEKGYTPVTFRFNFYGHRTFTLKKDGCRIHEEVRKVRRPIYGLPLIDVLADLGPVPLKDHKTFHFDLEPMSEVSTDDLLERAREMKSRVTGKPVPREMSAPEKPAEGEGKPVVTTPPEKPRPEVEPAENRDQPQK